MRVSLIVCTRNRAARLAPFLSCIAALESPPGGWELVLVDNASRDETRSILDRFGKDAAFPVQCVHAALPGLSRARNSGLACARGQILAFTDDDCYPRPDYLRALVEVFDEGDCGFVGGRVVLHDPGDAPVGVTDVDQAIDIRPHSFVPPSLIQGANMAFAREVVRAIGEFDPLLGAGTSCVAGEDIEYIARAVWAGWSGRYDPRPIVAHHHGRKPGHDADQQSRGYDYGTGAHYVKMLLSPGSRRVYLYDWYRRCRRRLRQRQAGRIRRELVGGARYVVQRLGQAALSRTPSAAIPNERRFL